MSACENCRWRGEPADKIVVIHREKHRSRRTLHEGSVLLVLHTPDTDVPHQTLGLPRAGHAPFTDGPPDYTHLTRIGL